LLASGISGDSIDGRLRRGRLHVLHTGVYQVVQPRVRAPAKWQRC
jgi:hypothetical protein